MSHRISKCHHISNEPPHDFRQLLTNPVYCTVFTCTLLHTSTCSCLFLFLSFCGYLSDMPETSLATEMAEIFLARSTDSLREVFLSAIFYSFLLYVKNDICCSVRGVAVHPTWHIVLDNAKTRIDAGKFSQNVTVKAVTMGQV